jgi:tetratricopeptide (TPR) repeat protein
MRIQRFEVLELLGTGAMGAVYRARDPHLGREVAIKVLTRPAEAATSQLSSHHTLDLRGAEPADKLLAEAQMMARLSHPHVLPVYEVGLADQGLFLVMEYIAGCDLRTWLSENRSTPELLEVFAQATRGLAEAHAHGVVHGDFKPENVLVGLDGRIRVADFGLSRLVSQTMPPVRVERAGGTPYYMAPELWRGEEASIPADVYAVCAALAEALGAEPADHDRLDPILRARSVERRLRATIAAGLSDDPRARPTVSAVLAALTARPAMGARRRIAAVAGAAVIGAAAIGVAAALAPVRGEAACDANLQFAGRWDAQRRAALEASEVTAQVEKARQQLGHVLGQVCQAERRGELSVAQVLRRTSCLERRGIELDASAARIAAEHMSKKEAIDVINEGRPARECLELEAPPLPVDRAPVAALYRRLVATYASELASPQRTRELATIEGEARALGERELEGRAALLLGMRQIESDQLAAADASLARSQDVASAIHSVSIAFISLVERGIVADIRGDPKAAYTYASLAFQIGDKPTASKGRRIHARYALARALVAVGRPGDAIARVDEALALGPEDDPWTETVLRQVKIVALEQLRRYDEALGIAREVAEIERKASGETSHGYGIALNVIAWQLLHTGDRVGALDYRRRALAAIQAGASADHSTVTFQRMLVAGDLAVNGQLDQALDEARAVFAIVDNNESVREDRSGLLVRLGRITFLSGRFEEGMRLFEEGLDALISDSGQDHPSVLSDRLEHIAFEIELGRWDDAERHMAALARSYGSRNDQALPLALLEGIQGAELARARRDPRAAEARARQALAVMEELHGTPEDREDLLRVLGASLVDQGRWQEALESLAAATTIARARFGHADRLALIDVERARALAGSGRRAEAEALARSARVVFREFPGHPRALQAIEALLGEGQQPARRAPVVVPARGQSVDRRPVAATR